MRLVVFDDYRIGVLDKDDAVHDVSDALPGFVEGDRQVMNRLIAGFDTRRALLEEAALERPGLALSSLRLRPPNPAPTHLFAAPVNYRSHVGELHAQGAVGPSTAPSGATAAELGFFLKATGSISGPSDPIELPVNDLPDRRFDHEGEIALVIGREARAVAPEEAVSYIFGYTIVVDVTLRGSPEHNEERVQRKSYASFSPMGPCIVTADEAGDWRELSVQLHLNGEQRQDARALDQIVDIPNLVSRASHVLALLPGDVYSTGSPAGVGAITPGDTVVVSSRGIGTMTLAVVARGW